MAVPWITRPSDGPSHELFAEHGRRGVGVTQDAECPDEVKLGSCIVVDLRVHLMAVEKKRRRHKVIARPVRMSRHVGVGLRSEEHTSELQSRSDLVCRLLLEKKKKQ